MRTLAIFVTGEPVPGALAARGTWAEIIRGTAGDAWRGAWQDIDGRAELPSFEPFAGIIITGSAANVPSREPWILELERYLVRAVEAQVPIFGICFGHQLLGQALGGLVIKNPRGREIGTVAVRFQAADPLLDPEQAQLQVNMTHVDSVVTLPPGAQALARTELDDHAMVRFNERTWGVQFHPEIDAEIMGHYVAARRNAMLTEGLDASSIERSIADTPASAAILHRFVRGLR